MIEANQAEARELRDLIFAKVRNGEAATGAETVYLLSRLADITLQTIYTVTDMVQQNHEILAEMRAAREEERKRSIPPFVLKVAAGAFTLALSLAGWWITNNDKKISGLDERVVRVEQRESVDHHWLEVLDKRVEKMEIKP